MMSGTLCGTGTISGPVTIFSNGTLSPGDGAIGALAMNNSLALRGTTLIKLDAAAGTNAELRGMSRVTYGGTLTVTNLGGTLAAGDHFKIFDATTYTGNFATLHLPLVGAGLAWAASDLTNGALSVVLAPVVPRINQAALVGTNLVVAGSGGAADYGYEVLFSTNLALPLSYWTAMASNHFDGAGGFLSTNAVDPSLRQGFYAIKIP